MNRLSDESCEFIKAEVAALFARLGIKRGPVNGIEIAQKMGITLVPYSTLTEEQRRLVITFSDDACYLSDQYGNECIFYNNLKPATRINWSILHEIGHVVLGHCGSDMDEQVREIEANFFAKYAIVPPIWVHMLQLTTVTDVQKHFLVSYEAAGNCLNYYYKWKRHIGGGYQEYDKILMAQI